MSIGKLLKKGLAPCRLSDQREASINEGPAAITCLSPSMDGRYMLANLQSHVIHRACWCLLIQVAWPLLPLAAHHSPRLR